MQEPRQKPRNEMYTVYALHENILKFTTHPCTRKCTYLTVPYLEYQQTYILSLGMALQDLIYVNAKLFSLNYIILRLCRIE